MTLYVLFPDGSEVTGTTPTHLLTKLMGGWNPDESIFHLRRRLAWRAGIVDNPEQSDADFLNMMDAAGAWTVGVSHVSS